MQRLPWIERRFAFDLPLGLFPNLLERLRGTPARLEDRVKDLSMAVLTHRLGDSWSIQENAGHLLAVESLWHGRLDDFDAGLEVLRPADMENRRTEEADYNVRRMEDLLRAFRESRTRLVGRLEGLEESEIARSAWHRRLDRPMRVLDLVVFAADHDDHHLARITELIRLLTDSEAATA